MSELVEGCKEDKSALLAGVVDEAVADAYLINELVESSGKRMAQASESI